jgi:hypothetical protein
MQTTLNPHEAEMTTAEQLAAAVAAVTDPDELTLIEAAMGPVDERNRPLVLTLLVLLSYTESLAAAIADNAIDSGQRVPTQIQLLARVDIRRIVDHLLTATTWTNSETFLALPHGHRLPTNLDAHA